MDRTERFELRLTAVEKTSYESAARKMGVDLATWMRMVLTTHVVTSKAMEVTGRK